MPTAMVLESRVSPLSSIAQGVAATLRLITDPALAGTTGEFYDGTERSRARAQAYDPEFRRRLRRNTDALLASALEGRSRAE